MVIQFAFSHKLALDETPGARQISMKLIAVCMTTEMTSNSIILEERVSMSPRHSPNHSPEWIGALRIRKKHYLIDQRATGLSPSDERTSFE
jgi:hypothetical protein